MLNPYASFCEDFYVNMRLGSQLTFPHNRETVLHLFERVQKSYPSMTRFRKADNIERKLSELLAHRFFVEYTKHGFLAVNRRHD